MKVTVNRMLAGTAAALLLSGVGALLLTDSASAIEASPNVATAVAATQVKVPVHVPVNVCGDSANGQPVLDPAFGNTCVND